MSIWNALKYGWTVTYFLTIEGLPVVWSEVELPSAVPAGFDYALGLVIDRSAEVGQAVNRDTGLGEGLSLSWLLLDSDNIRAWMQRASAQTILSDTVSATDTVLPVVDGSGFPSSGAVYLGLERVTYTGNTGATLTGCTRGTGGSLATIHAVGTASGLVCDLPRYWRGRQVRLWALPVEPGGTVIADSMDLYLRATEVWRGVLDQGPGREGAAFAFEALSLDRVLSNTLPAGYTGTVLSADYDRVRVGGSDGMQLHLETRDATDTVVWAHDLVVYPYDAVSWLSEAEQQAAIGQAWDDAVTLAVAGADIGSLTFFRDYGTDVVGKQPLKLQSWEAWLVSVVIHANAFVTRLTVSGTVGGVPIAIDRTWPAGMLQHAQELWTAGANQLAPLGKQQVEFGAPAMMAVQLDKGADAVPLQGIVRVGTERLSYSDSDVVANVAYLLGLKTTSGAPWSPPKNIIGTQVELVFSQKQTLKYLALRMLQSSGTLNLRGPHDQWGHGEGYALDTDAIDVDSFSLLDAAGLGILYTIGGTDCSFEGQLGGLLALNQLGCVARPDSSGTVRLGIVRTTPAGSAYSAAITDAELLSIQSDPVTQVRRTDPVSGVLVRLSSDGEATGPTYVLRDWTGASEVGGSLLEFDVPLAPGQQIGQQVKAWAAALLAASTTLQVVELKVVPWVRANTGDLVYLQLTHPAIWSWASGTPGYTGLARVLGQRRQLLDGTQIVAVIMDGATKSGALCPSCRVVALTGSGSSPVTIDVPRQHYDHLSRGLASHGAPVPLRHYRPGLGNEGGGGHLSYSAVEDTGTVARLTISATSLGYDIAASGDRTASILTYPALGTATAWQALFAHVGDGSIWS